MGTKFAPASWQKFCFRRLSPLFIAAGIVIVTAATTNAQSQGLDRLSFADRYELESLADDQVDVAIKVAHAAAPNLKTALSAGRNWVEFPELDVVIARVRASAILEKTDGVPIERIEILDPKMTQRIVMILAAVRRLEAVHGTLFSVGALNMSLGVPKAFLGKNRSGEETVREALGRLVERHIPVVMSIGNDGPDKDTANPWALAPGVIIATATDQTGSGLWSGSSRLPLALAPKSTVFAAHGYLSVGAWASGSPKTPQMLEAERQVDLTALVGAGNEHLYRVDSGTSYAAAEVTRSICLVHQAVMAIRFSMSNVEALQGVLPPYVAGYFDSGIDRTHPMFARRLVDERQKYGGVTFEVMPEQRNRLSQIAFRDVRLDLRPTTDHVVEILKRAARSVPSDGTGETGYGFVSRDLVGDRLAQLTIADLVAIFADKADPRYSAWVSETTGETMRLFSARQVDIFREYCDSYSLVYMIKVL